MSDLDELPRELHLWAERVRQARHEQVPAGDAGDQVWARISAELGDELLGTTATPVPPAPAPSAPWSSAGGGRSGTATGAQQPASSAGAGGDVVPLRSARVSRRAAWSWGAGGLAAGLALAVLGQGLVGGVLRQSRTVASTALVTLDEARRELGRAVLVERDDDLVLQVRASQRLSNPDGYLEAWLINTDGERMISLGQFREGESADYVVDSSAWEGGYRIVDISRERYDGAVQHSGDSVVRGQLA